MDERYMRAPAHSKGWTFALCAALILVVLIILALAAAPLYAQTLAPATVIVPPPIWDDLNSILLGLFLVLAGAVWKWLDARSPLKNTQAEDIARQAFNALLANAALFGLSQVKSLESKVGEFDVKSPAVAAGANFVIQHGPGLAAKMGVDVTTPAGQAAIVRSVTLRIAAAGSSAVKPADLTLPPEIINHSSVADIRHLTAAQFDKMLEAQERPKS